MTLGAHRTLEQDLGYAVYNLAEIALRALSPAINDPITGMMCIDWMADAVRRIETPSGPCEALWTARATSVWSCG